MCTRGVSSGMQQDGTEHQYVRELNVDPYVSLSSDFKADPVLQTC